MRTLSPTRRHPRPLLLASLACLALAPRLAAADAVCAPWPDGTLCYPQNPCLGPGVCQRGSCVSNDLLPVGTLCRVSMDPCRSESTCDGQGACSDGALLPVGSYCGSSGSPCLGDRTCDARGQCTPGSQLPVGTVCSSGSACLTSSVCDALGVCAPGAPRPEGTSCGAAELCRAPGRCDRVGACVPGASINEGRGCATGDGCRAALCQGGVCRDQGPRDCSQGDPCLKRDSCMPGVGCVAVNICDMRQAPDLLMSLPDLVGGPDISDPARDGAPADLLTRDARDAAARDLSGADAALDAALGSPDGGRDAGPRDAVRYVGGACQCQLGIGRAGGGGPRSGGVGLLGLCLGVLVQWARRATRSRSARRPSR